MWLKINRWETTGNSFIMKFNEIILSNSSFGVDFIDKNLQNEISKKINDCLLSYQFAKRFSLKMIGKFIVHLYECFENFEIKVGIFYDPKNSISKEGKLGFVILFLDGCDDVLAIRHWQFWFPLRDSNGKVKSHKS